MSRGSRRRTAGRLFVASILLALAATVPVHGQSGELTALFTIPAAPTTGAPVVLHATTTCSNPFSGPPQIVGTTITLQTTYFGLYPPCAFGLPSYDVSFNLGALAAGTYTVNVIGNGGVPDGTVVFTYSFVVAVAGTGGVPAPQPTLSVSPTAPGSHDHVILHASIQSDPDHLGVLPQFQVQRAGNTFEVSTYGLDICPVPPGPYQADLDLGTLPDGSYQAQLLVGGASATVSFVVSDPVSSPPTDGILLDGGAFRVKLLHGATLQNGVAVGGTTASAVQLSDQSAYFWFFDQGNVEVTVKFLDGRPVNGHFWLFAASMTTEPYVLEITDVRPTCSGSCVKLYAGQAGHNRNVIDTKAF
jgi:hypothetical protein